MSKRGCKRTKSVLRKSMMKSRKCKRFKKAKKNGINYLACDKIDITRNKSSDVTRSSPQNSLNIDIRSRKKRMDNRKTETISQSNNLTIANGFEIDDHYCNNEIEEKIDSGGINLIPTQLRIKKT